MMSTWRRVKNYANRKRKYIRRKAQTKKKRRRTSRTKKYYTVKRSNFTYTPIWRDNPKLFLTNRTRSRKQKYQLMLKRKRLGNLRHVKRQETDKGRITASDVNECTYACIQGSAGAVINGSLANLNVWDNSTGAIVNSTTLFNNENFRCHVARKSKLLIRNNQSETVDGAVEGNVIGVSSIRVDVWYVVPKYTQTIVTNSEDAVLTSLSASFVNSGVTTPLTNRTANMNLAMPTFKRKFYMKSYGSFNLQPGDARQFTYNHNDKWWYTSVRDSMGGAGDEYFQKWDGFWLYRQQGQWYANKSGGLEETEPVVIGTRLTSVVEQLYTLTYSQNPDPIKTYVTQEVNIDTEAQAAEVEGKQAQAVDDDADEEKGIVPRTPKRRRVEKPFWEIPNVGF